MRKILLKDKTGFIIKDPFEPVIIRDKRGILFYDTTPLLPKVREFNLPAGIPLYLEKGSIVRKERPRKYKLTKLPNRERNKRSPFNFQIRFGNNPNKATIYWRLGIILFDNSFKEKPLPLIYFILFHEFGHKLYKTEKYADLYSKNMMLIRGFNPYQIGISQINGLSSKNYERKRYIVDNLINIQRWKK